MELLINGESHTAADGCSMLELLESLEIDPGRVAIEYNTAILKKDLWSSTRLKAGDRVEIVHFVGGGR
jgi:thiamine biosynthesis protein ThiS